MSPWTASLPARKTPHESAPEGSRSGLLRLRLATVAALCLSAGVAMAQEPKIDPWPGLVTDIFHGRAITPHEGVVALDAPKRAEDAAIVPMTISLVEPALRAATLVIDENPMPMAAAFSFGEGAGVQKIETRVRVNSYTNVHVVGRTADGALHSVVKFVKASGGCSAPAIKDQDEAASNLGKMKYREFASENPALHEAQIMIRHPNNSGLQMDPITRAYIPAHYVDKVEVRQGDALIFSMEGGISLSEDPSFRFVYKPNGAKTIRVEAHDNEGGVFKGEWPIGGAS
ncbi:quinoprotein dehydrogenase-associated SoxYZ-like carrier [Methylosinus sp. H3A]|uniref:quinoprotein dehydrogenase-associated SoxYZ-like carrier n=1 Tax=Methylosinus sp. H3A TaxID=2785786 RepID=UPI0018C27589|nr:quinoprotein dehydrogenase-associated SoxYZ-like carrier [Methylosinus sp. H3A]MBG0810129.1 quinoprotein dehydrogenase-associated SoxYZ-like carrier [Methylosinus sp. H3A]